MYGMTYTYGDVPAGSSDFSHMYERFLQAFAREGTLHIGTGMFVARCGQQPRPFGLSGSTSVTARPASAASKTRCAYVLGSPKG
jgi:hypothetical protein